MIGVAIPAHNEEFFLDGCLAALLAAARDPALRGETVHACVVLDACDDGSRDAVRRHQARFADAGLTLDCLEVEAHQVGVARAAGARHLLDCGARWLAFTDADTRVSPQWLAAQLALEVDVVCGSVAVDDWSPHGGNAQRLREHFGRTYNDRDGHHHIHGANLGVSAAAYVEAGGFEAVSCHEDVLLVKALENIGARFAWSARPRVFTSARTDARARGGFGDTLLAAMAQPVA
jgi:glycosyltransferase involved in cell wall biosynthesis